MSLRLVRGTYENKHGYRVPQRYATSSGPSHDKSFLAMGFPSAQNIQVLEVVPVPEDLRRTGRFSLFLAYTALAGAWDMGFRADEIIGIIRREMRAPTYTAGYDTQAVL